MQQFKTGNSLAIPLAGETWSGGSWVLVPRKEYFVSTSLLLGNNAEGSWGCPGMFVYLWRLKPHCGGSAGLGRSNSADTLARPQAFCGMSTFLAQGDAAWSEYSVPGVRDLCAVI